MEQILDKFTCEWCGAFKGEEYAVLCRTCLTDERMDNDQAQECEEDLCRTMASVPDKRRFGLTESQRAPIRSTRFTA